TESDVRILPSHTIINAQQRIESTVIATVEAIALRLGDTVSGDNVVRLVCRRYVLRNSVNKFPRSRIHMPNHRSHLSGLYMYSSVTLSMAFSPVSSALSSIIKSGV